MRFNTIDMILYLSLPIVAILILPVFLLPHPVLYPYHVAATDWSILKEIWGFNRCVLLLVLLSGIFALVYNMLLYNLVTVLSPVYAQFAANFSKISSIFPAVIMGLEPLPSQPWGGLIILGILGNVAAFALYSIWPYMSRRPKNSKS